MVVGAIVVITTTIIIITDTLVHVRTTTTIVMQMGTLVVAGGCDEALSPHRDLHSPMHGHTDRSLEDQVTAQCLKAARPWRVLDTDC